MGLNVQKNEIGVLIDDSLCNWSINPKSQDATKRVKKLKNLSQDLQQAIFENDEDERIFAMIMTSPNMQFLYKIPILR